MCRNTNWIVITQRNISISDAGLSAEEEAVTIKTVFSPTEVRSLSVAVNCVCIARPTTSIQAAS